MIMITMNNITTNSSSMTSSAQQNVMLSFAALSHPNLILPFFKSYAHSSYLPFTSSLKLMSNQVFQSHPSISPVSLSLSFSPFSLDKTIRNPRYDYTHKGKGTNKAPLGFNALRQVVVADYAK